MGWRNSVSQICEVAFENEVLFIVSRPIPARNLHYS